MSKSAKIARIKASIEGRNASPEGFRATMSVNTVPVITATVNATNDKPVRRPMSASLVSTMRGRQQDRLAGVDKPNISFSAEDGNGGTIDFDGFLTAPVVEISKHHVGYDLTILGVDGALDGLDLSIYRLGAQSSREGTSTDGEGFSFPEIPSASGGDVIASLSELTDLLLQSLQPAINAEQDKILQEVIRNQDAVNTGLPIEVWRKILAESDVQFESWAQAFSTNKYYARQVSEYMAKVLCEKSGGFWGTLNALMAAFQMHYVPTFNGPGALRRNDTKAGKPDGSIDLSVTQMTLSDGSHRLLQPGGVVMMAPGAESSRKETSRSRFVVAAQYPDNLLPGYVHREMYPQWLVDAKNAPLLASEIGKKKSSSKLDLSLSGLLQRQSSVAEYLEKVGAASAGILTEMCKVTFEELQLAHSTASITTNLDFTIPVGVRKTINVRGGGSFEGFIKAVTHAVDLRSGKQLNSSTTIELSHVRY